MRISKMPDYDFCRNMNKKMIANRIRDLKSDDLSSLVENVTVMVNCGQFPYEAFHEVRDVYKLLLTLKINAAEDEAYN